MAICEEDKSAEYLDRGSYGLISRINGNVGCPEKKTIEVRTFTPRVLWQRFVRREKLNISEISLIGAIYNFQHNIFSHHQIDDSDISRLDKELQPNTPDSKIAGAQFYTFIVDCYLEQERQAIRENKIGEPKPSYILGLILSDTLEVLPTETAARLLLACSDPQTARAIITRDYKTAGLERIDPQVYAVEGIVLAPLETRRRIFQEMATVSPGRQGGARRLLSLIASNWPNYNSKFCGQTSIRNNIGLLNEEIAMEKILEVQADLLALGEMIDL